MAKNTGKSRRPIAPAEGERRSLLGILPQYRACALIVLQALRRQEFQFLELTHAGAGQVDDFIIGTPARVDAYQVKWREHPKPFTFRGLTEATQGEPLIKQLANGWRLLKNMHLDRRVVVHLFTCDYASDQAAKTRGSAKAASLARFLAEAWVPYRSGDSGALSIHSDQWKALRTSSSLQEAEFEDFVRDCELEFSVKLETGQLLGDREAELVDRQLRELAEHLKNLAVDPSRKHHFERRELLQALNWTSSFELLNRHDFGITDFYAPIEETVKQLNQALSKFAGGYVALIGAPGSGKSTLLSRMYEDRAQSERWVRYYAFVPGTQEAANTRGESVNFLHDLTLSLERLGFSAGSSKSEFDRQQLLSRLNRQLQLLGQDHQSTGHRWIILIDGLDHVPREQHVDRSFLSDLPDASGIPEGVFILIGSQSTQLSDVPNSIRAALDEAGRTIRIDPLDRAAVFSITARRLPKANLTQTQRETIYSLSNGHPLALSLLLNQFLATTTASEIDQILSDAEPYTGDIDQLYASHWTAIDNDFELVKLLALVARLRRHIDLNWLHQWADPALLHRIKTEFSHLFLQETESRWYFFHNSFRLFLRQRTSKIVGATPAANEKALNLVLAERCAATHAPSAWRWEQLFHRVEAEDHQIVLQLALPGYFRDQLLEFRPIDAILGDIRHALRSAGALHDVVACVRLILCAAEMGYRSNVLDEFELPELLLDFGISEPAIEHIFNGLEPRVANKAAMRISRQLARLGYLNDAQHLFERTEPLDPISTGEAYAQELNEKTELLVEWVRTALYFRPVAQVFSVIQSTQLPARQYPPRSSEEETIRLRRYLLFILCTELDASGRHAEAREYEKQLNLSSPKEYEEWFWIQARRWKARLETRVTNEVASDLESILSDSRLQQLTNEARTYLAEIAYLVLGSAQQVRELVNSIPQPPMDFEPRSTEDGIAPYLFRFRLNRLHCALGAIQRLAALVPDAPDSRNQAIVLLERAIVQLAYFWGDAWRGRIYTAGDVRQKTTGILRLYERDQSERREWSGWHTLVSVKKDLYSLLIDSIAQHGQEALTELRELILSEWNHPKRRWLWPVEVRRAVLLKFYHLGANLAWVQEEFANLEKQILKGRDNSDRVRESKEHAKAYLELGREGEAKLWLRQMFQTSFGVGYRKDYQLDSWMEWLPLINAEDTAGTARRIMWFARAAVTLESTTEGRSARTASKKLIEIAMSWSPRRAVQLLKWFFEQQVVWYAECVETVLSSAIEKSPNALNEVIACVNELLIPFTTQAHTDVAAGCINAGFQQGGAARASEIAKSITDAAGVMALPSTRRGWALAIIEALRDHHLEADQELKRLSDQDGKQSKIGQAEEKLTLKSGGELRAEEINERLTSVSGIISLIEEATEVPIYQWREKIASTAAQAGLSDVKRLVEAAKGVLDTSLILSGLSKRLSQLGDRAAARSIALEALNKSSEYGWSYYNDGATRVKALEALVAADPGEGRKIAFKTLIRDITAPRSFPGGTGQSLRSVVPLIVETIPVQAIWNELEQYLQELCCDANTGDDPDLLVPPQDDNANRAIIDLLLFHLHDPTHLLEQGSCRALISLALQGNAHAQQGLREMLTGSDEQAVPATAAIAAVARQDPEAARPFSKEMMELITHPNLSVWKTAWDVVARLGVTDIPVRPSKELPPVYSLQLPEHPVGFELDPEPGKPMPDTNDFRRRLAPFDGQLIWVADMLNAPSENLLYRTSTLMSDVAPPEQWTAAAESHWRNVLESANLKFSYRRPRTRVARHAMYRAISELLDAGVVRPDQERLIWEMLRPYDLDMLQRRPERRPKDCIPIQGLSDSDNPPDDWLTILDSASARILQRGDSRIVIAEQTKLKRLTWKEPTESVKSGVILTNSLSVPTNPWRTFGLSFVIANYLKLPHDEKLQQLAVKSSGETLDSAGGNWLAFNPDVAHELSWRLSTDGLFRWTDELGNPMVESIWWADGSLEHHPPEHEDEVAEGWMVVCTQEALTSIRQKFGPLRRLSLIRRSYTEKSERVHGKTSSIEELTV